MTIIARGHNFIACSMSDGTFHIRHKGRTFKFEFHQDLGPTLLNKLGSPVFPPRPKHPFWAAFAEWERRQSLRKKRKEKALSQVDPLTWARLFIRIKYLNVPSEVAHQLARTNAKVKPLDLDAPLAHRK